MPRSKPLQAVLMATPDEIEAEFYEALQQGDVERLMAVWSEDDDIVCVHPGGTRVQGHAAVRASFDELFSQGAIDTRPARVRRTEVGACSVHHVVEQVRVSTTTGSETGYVIATNLYVKTPAGWRLLVHHASPGSTQALDERADSSGPMLH